MLNMLNFWFGVCAFLCLYAGAALSMYQYQESTSKKLFWVFLALLILSVFLSIRCWQLESRWPVFIVWGVLSFLSFIQGMEENTKDAGIVFMISLVGLFVTGNILGFRYDMMWPLGIVSVMEFFTVMLIVIGSLPEK